MSARIIAAAVLSLSLSAHAFAQTSDDVLRGGTRGGTPGVTGSAGVSGTGSATGSIPAEWNGEIADALFADPGAGTLRSEDQVRENWTNLSAEQQAAVRDHCGTTDVARTDSGSDDPNLTTGSTASDETSGQAAKTDRLTVVRASIVRLCDWLKDM
jgi:hypothetical protein